MLKIAMIQRFLPSQSRGGVGHFTHGLANTLAHRGHAVTVFSLDLAPKDARYRVTVLPTTRTLFGFPTAPLTFPFQVARQDFTTFDLIHAQGDDQWISRSHTAPIIRTLHGSALSEAIHNGWRVGSPKRFLMHLYFYANEWIAARRADQVVAISEDTRRHFSKIHAIIPNGVDLEQFSSITEQKSDAPTILFVGELFSRKRGQLLRELFLRTIKPALPTAELWLVSPEPANGDGVRHWGNLSAEALVKLYQQAWVFCLPSSYEGFGRPYVEALAAGTPVVASPNPGAREILENGKFGFVVPDEKLGETLLRLLREPALRLEMAAGGRERAPLYSWENVADRYEKIYENALRRRPAHACAT